MENPEADTEQASAADPTLATTAKVAWYRSPRFKVSMLTLVATTLVGLVYTFAQPSIYRSQATLLVSTAGLSGPQTPATAAGPDIDSLRPILFSDELLSRTQTGLAAAGYSVVSASQIKNQLRATIVADSSLLEISAQGSDAQFLPLIINTWLDVYLAAMSTSLDTTPAPTQAPVSRELEQLTDKLKRAKSDLEQFRQAQGSGPADWDDRETRSKLTQLNRALKPAIQQEKRAQSALDAAQKNIARGKSVLARGEQRELSNLERQLEALETKQADLSAQYTRKYLELQPKLRVIPEQIEELKLEIDQLKTLGTRKVMDELQREQTQTQQTVAELKQQIEDLEGGGKDPGALAAKHKALATKVENLEAELRGARAHLNLPVSNSSTPYPELTIIERASVSNSPIGADARRNAALIALAVGLACAGFAFWLYGFLNPVRASNPPAANIPRDGRNNNESAS